MAQLGGIPESSLPATLVRVSWRKPEYATDARSDGKLHASAKHDLGGLARRIVFPTVTQLLRLLA